MLELRGLAIFFELLTILCFNSDVCASFAFITKWRHTIQP